MQSREYPFHPGARGLYRFAGWSLCATVIALPLGIWILWRLKGAGLSLTPTTVTARGIFLSVSVNFSEVERFGMLRIGVGGWLARRKVAGDVADHLCFRNPRGRTRAFMVSLFEESTDITSEITRTLGTQPESVGLHLRWPKQAP